MALRPDGAARAVELQRRTHTDGTGPLFASINEQVSEQMIQNGFKNIVLMGDHGGGQKELADVARKLTEKYHGLPIPTRSG